MANYQVSYGNRSNSYHNKIRSRDEYQSYRIPYQRKQRLFSPYQNSKQKHVSEKYRNQKSAPVTKYQPQIQTQFPSVKKPVTTKSIEEIVKLLFSNENTSSKPSAPVAQRPVNIQSKVLQKVNHQPPRRNTRPSEAVEAEPDVQDEWKKYKASNPPLGGFPVYKGPSKAKK